MKQKLSILSVALIATLAGMVVAPVLGQIQLAFPDANVTAIKLISVIHAIVIIPFIFVSSWLTQRISKKSVLLFSLVLYLIGGIGSSVANSIEIILAFRVLLGAAVGLLTPISTSLVADFFVGDERASMMGKVTGTNQIGGVLAFVLAGILAAISWRIPFFIYGISILTFIAVALYLPKQPPLMKGKNVAASKIPKQIFILGVLNFILFIFVYTIPTNMAIYIMEFKIAPQAIIGILIACTSVGAIVGGMIFVPFTRLLRSYVVPVQILLAAASFYIITLSTTQPIMLGIGIFLFGFSWGVLVPLILNGVATAVDKTQTMRAMAIVQIFMCLGQFTSPILMAYAGKIFGVTSSQFVYTFSAYVTTGIAILSFILVIFKRTSSELEENKA